MNKKRKSILDRLTEEDQIKKVAFISEQTEVDQTTADQLAKDIYEKIFDEEIAKLFKKD